MIDINETSFAHNLLLTNRQVLNLCKDFANNFLVKMKLSKTKLSSIVQLDRFLG